MSHVQFDVIFLVSCQKKKKKLATLFQYIWSVAWWAVTAQLLFVRSPRKRRSLTALSGYMTLHPKPPRLGSQRPSTLQCLPIVTQSDRLHADGMRALKRSNLFVLTGVNPELYLSHYGYQGKYSPRVSVLGRLQWAKRPNKTFISYPLPHAWNTFTLYHSISKDFHVRP